MAKETPRRNGERIRKLLEGVVAEIIRDWQEEGFLDEVPHYTEIASKSLGIGAIFARLLQEKLTERLSEQGEGSAQCPECGRECELEPTRRAVDSIVGGTVITEARGFCKSCRRFFLPTESGSV